MADQLDLFGKAIAPDEAERRRRARTSYRLLSVRDTVTPGCAACANADWTNDRCRLGRHVIDIDNGNCDEQEREEG